MYRDVFPIVNSFNNSYYAIQMTFEGLDKLEVLHCHSSIDISSWYGQMQKMMQEDRHRIKVNTLDDLR